MSLVHMTGFDLFGMYVLIISSQTINTNINIALLGVRFDLTLGSCHSECLVLAISIVFSLLIQHLAEISFVQVGRLEWCCCCLRGLLCDGSDANDALRMVIILLYQDVLLAPF